MPGIDFNRLRHEITMEHVLDLLDFESFRRRGGNGTDSVRCTNPNPSTGERFQST